MITVLQKFISRPVLTSALSVLILLLGIFGLYKMPLRYLPKMNQEMVTVHVDYPGATSDVVKSFVVDKMQSALVGIAGIDYLTSSSAVGHGDIMIYLTGEVAADILLPVIRAKISAIEAQLPSDVKPATITQTNLDHHPMLILGFSSSYLDRVATADYLRRVMAPRIENITGVSQAEVWGDQYAMQIYLDPASLIAYHLVPQDIFNALKSENVLTASGSSQGKWFNYTLSVNSALHTEDEFNRMIIKVVNHVPVTLREVGYAKIGAADDDFMVYYNEQPATFVGVQILPGANPLATIKNILKQFPQLIQSMPADLKAYIVLNRATYIHDSLSEVIKTLFESIILVLLVMYFFLDNIKAALIPLVTIPLSLLGICFFMNSMGYSLNTMTLLAMVLAVSLVVDDAIVLVENCVRHISPNCSAMNASMCSIQELAVPIIAMTLTLAAVYLPIGFSGGLLGQLFTEFAFTLAGSVLVSGLLALTLSPMLAAHWLQAHNPKRFSFSDRMMNRTRKLYQFLLGCIFCNKKTMLYLWFVVFLALPMLYYAIPKELAPRESMNFLMVSGEAPTHANRNYLEHYAAQTQKIYSQIKALTYAVILAPDERYIAYLMMHEHNDASALVASLQKQLSRLTGMSLHVIVPPAFINSGPAIQFVLQGNEDYKNLYQLAKNIETQALHTDEFSYLTDDLQYTQPQATINVNRDAMASVNVPMRAVSETLSILMSHYAVQTFSAKAQSADVLIKMLAPHPESILDVPIQTSNQINIPLSSIASINYTVVPKTLNQFQKINSVTISGEMNSRFTLSDGLYTLQHIALSVLPKTVSINYAGNTRQFYQEANRMIWVFIFAILVIFLLLSMQFESYRDALVILLGSVPFALFSALLSLKLGLATFNIYTEIGLLTLIGLISKHGILIVRFANEVKTTQNKDAQTAVFEAATLRLRPILMTTVAIVLAALPLIFTQGAGCESRHAMGLVIAFGMGLGTLFTLFLLPVIYIFFQRDV